MVALKLRNEQETERPRMRIANPKLDRRVFPRTDCNEQIEVRRTDHSIIARQQPRLEMEMRDVSVGGCCAISDVPVNAGERLAVRVGRKGLAAGWHAFGKVVRCEVSGTGWRVAVEFDALPAA